MAIHDEPEQMQLMLLTNDNDLLMADNDAAAADDDDAGLEEDLKALRARLAELEAEFYDVDDDVLPPESYDWAVGVEAMAQHSAEVMAQELDDLHRSLSLLPSSASAAPALRAEAVRVAALRADAEEIVAAARRLTETDLRRLAAAEAGAETGYIVTLKELALIVGKEEMAVNVEAWMASVAGRLNRGAAEFAGRTGEEAFVAAMRREAARAEEARAEIELARCRMTDACCSGSGSSMLPSSSDVEMEQASQATCASY